MLPGSYFVVAAPLAVVVTLGLVLVQRGDPYFPPETVQGGADCADGPHGRIDDFWSPIVADQLRALGEPPLQGDRRRSDAPRKSLRFTWMRSFHPPVVIRVHWEETGQAQLFAIAEEGGFEQASRRIVRVNRPLTREEQAHLEGLIEPAFALDASRLYCDYGGPDGARWVFESAVANDYRVKNFQSPVYTDEEGKAAENLGRHLLSLTGWNVEPVY